MSSTNARIVLILVDFPRSDTEVSDGVFRALKSELAILLMS